MSVRVWSSPPVQVTNPQGFLVWTAKVVQYCSGGYINVFPSDLTGAPASTWIMTFGRAADWTAASADAQCTDLFAGDLPSTINTVPDLVAYLRPRTVGDVPTARRQTITTNLNNLGIVTSDFTLTTPLLKVLQRILSTLMEKDSNFGTGFVF